MFEFIKEFFSERTKKKHYVVEVLPPLEKRISHLAEGIKTIPKYLYDGE